MIIARIFEVKYAPSQEGLKKACREALAQMDAGKYGEELEEGYSQVLCYGVAFYKKHCLVWQKEYGPASRRS